MCAVGFIVAIGWISTIADEVVGILRAFGAIVGVSEAILGVTYSQWYYHVQINLTTGKLIIGFRGQCDSSQDGVPHDGHVCVFRWSNAEYSRQLSYLMIDILLGVGVSGLIITLTSSEEYRVSLSPTLLVSTVSLFLTLSSMLIVVPFNKWRMTRRFWNLSRCNLYNKYNN